MKILTAVLLFLSSVAASEEPTAEQLTLMRQYGLTVPPVIIDKREKSKIPEPSMSTISVRTVENGIDFNVEFGPAEVMELKPKEKPKLRAEILSEDPPQAEVVVLEFHATWCAKCKDIKAEIDATEKELKTVSFKRVDVDADKATAQKYSVTAIPRMILLVNGVKKADRLGSDECRGMRSWITEGISGKVSPPPVPIVKTATPIQYDPPPERHYDQSYEREYSPPRRVHGHSW